MKVDEHIKIADLTTVPIAIPMIAGPATITAAVTFPVQYSRFVTIVAILLALAVNLFFMLKARRIGSFLIKYNFCLLYTSTGLAHYFEHLMFKGTDSFGTQNYEQEKPMLDRIEALFEVYRKTTDEAQRTALYRQIDSVSYEASKIAIPNEYDKLMAAIGATAVSYTHLIHGFISICIRRI